MPSYLRLEFDAPLQAWGGVAVDPRRPTDTFPRASALAGFLANALGWRHRDARRITDLQDSLDYAVREDRPPTRIWDFQTADLSGLAGWTRWGPESPGGASAKGTHILNKEYLADARFTLALGVSEGSPVDLDEIAEALARPARPLFLGRKSCPPASRILHGRVEADSALAALTAMDREGVIGVSPRIWCDAEVAPTAGTVREIWDRRDYETSRFDRSRRIAEFRADAPETGAEHG